MRDSFRSVTARWSSRGPRLASLAFLLVLTVPSAAPALGAGLYEDLLKSCAPQVGSMPLDARAPLGQQTSFMVHPRLPGGAPAPSCAGFTWVKVPGVVRVASLQWRGRITTNSWDCSHSTLAWGIYRKGAGAVWSWVGGGASFGNMPNGNGGTCYYDGTGTVNELNAWGAFSVGTNFAQEAEYRIAYEAWSHDDPNSRHPKNDCADPSNCFWPVQVTTIGTYTQPKQDFTVFRPSTGAWHTMDSVTGAVTSTPWGQWGDRIVHGDYDGDYNSDFAVARLTNGKLMWHLLNSSTGGSVSWEFGVTGDQTVVGGDYDGDGRTDLTVWRPSDGTWHIVNSNTWSYRVSTLGVRNDRPVVGDYDGDGRSDITAFRPSTGNWSTFLSRGNRIINRGWGTSGDEPLSGADFDGDRVTDVAVWRPTNGTFYWIDSADGQGWQRQWGQSGDVPVHGHYDTDHIMDFGVWRHTDGRWYYIYSSTGGWSWTAWGQSGDRPAAPFKRGL